MQTVLLGFDLEASYARKAVKSASNSTVKYFDFAFGSRHTGHLLENVKVQKRVRPKKSRSLKKSDRREEPLISPTTEFQRHFKRQRTIEASENKEDSQKSSNGTRKTKVSRQARPKQSSSSSSSSNIFPKKSRRWTEQEVLDTVSRLAVGTNFPMSSAFQERKSDYQAWHIMSGKRKTVDGVSLTHAKVAKKLKLDLQSIRH